jgi:FlaA1/EpsC-like NDP-sugar epimerase
MFIVPVIKIGKIKRKFPVKELQIEDLLERKAIVLDNKSISKQLKDKTILITGAAVIGSEIVRQVLGFNQNIIILDQAETPCTTLL